MLIVGCFAMPSVVLFPKNTQNFEIGNYTSAGCAAEPIKSVSWLIAPVFEDPHRRREFTHSMSVSTTQISQPGIGLAWATLAASTCALLLLAVWALQNQSRLMPDKFLAASNSEQNVSAEQLEKERQSEQLAAQQLKAEKLASEKLAAENQAAEKLAAEQLAEEKLVAEKLAAEKLATEKLAAEQLAEEKLVAEKLAAEKLAAEKRAAEKLAEEKLIAEKLAAEKLAAEKQAADKQAAEKLAAEKLAAEQLAAQKIAAEKLAIKELAAEKLAAAQLAVKKLDAEKLATEKLIAEKLAAKELAAVASTKLENNIPDAEAIADGSLTATANETPFEKLRREELTSLPGLAARVRFQLNEIDLRDSSRKPLDRVFELLFLYSETAVTVQVASNEYEIDNNNQLISRERALTLVNYLIDRGLDEDRFRIRALGKQRLPFDSHRVIVIATVIDE